MSFTTCQCILKDSAGVFLYFNFKNCKGTNSILQIRFQYILHDLAVIFSDFQNFGQLKRGDLIYWGKNNSAKWLYYLVLPICIPISKIWRTPVLCLSLDLNVFYMIDSAVHSSSFKNLLKLKRGGPNTLRSTISAEPTVQQQLSTVALNSALALLPFKIFLKLWRRTPIFLEGTNSVKWLNYLVSCSVS